MLADGSPSSSGYKKFPCLMSISVIEAINEGCHSDSFCMEVGGPMEVGIRDEEKRSKSNVLVVVNKAPKKCVSPWRKESFTQDKSLRSIWLKRVQGLQNDQSNHHETRPCPLSRRGREATLMQFHCVGYEPYGFISNSLWRVERGKFLYPEEDEEPSASISNVVFKLLAEILDWLFSSGLGTRLVFNTIPLKQTCRVFPR
nr:hypothetical protein [Tanacetum cinerariifolium]